MTSCESQIVKGLMRITAPVMLIVNIIIAITVICLVTPRRHGLPTIVMNKTKIFKHALETAFDENYGDFHSTLTKTSRQARAAPSLEFLSLLKPVLHLAGLDFDHSTSDDRRRLSPIRNWAVSEGSERNLMYNGILYENGSIIVPAKGVYLIYSHVKFYVENNKKKGQQNIFSHGIFRFNTLTQTEEPLLFNKVTECKEGINDGAHLEYPSDIRGVVRLNAGDQIMVKVSNFRLLLHDRDWHYIGVYLV